MAKSLWSALGMALILTTSANAESVALRVSEAKVVREPLAGQAVVDIAIDTASIAAMARFTGQRIGKQIRVLGGGRVLATPVIRDPLVGRNIQASGLDWEEARSLASRLRRDGRIVFEDIAP